MRLRDPLRRLALQKDAHPTMRIESKNPRCVSCAPQVLEVLTKKMPHNCGHFILGKTKAWSANWLQALPAGATGRIRTGDLLITNQLLYRLSHGSVQGGAFAPLTTYHSKDRLSSDGNP